MAAVKKVNLCHQILVVILVIRRARALLLGGLIPAAELLAAEGATASDSFILHMASPNSKPTSSCFTCRYCGVPTKQYRLPSKSRMYNALPDRAGDDLMGMPKYWRQINSPVRRSSAYR